MSKYNPLILRARKTLLMAGVCVGLVFGTAAAAQEASQQQQTELEFMEQVQQAQERIHEIQLQLGSIQRDTLDNEPALLEEIEALEGQAIARMEEEGHDPRGILERLEGLQEEFQAAEDSEQQQAVANEFQEEQMRLQEAQQVLAMDEDFLSAQEEVEENVLLAMQERHPETQELLDELNSIQEDMIALQRQYQSQQ